MKEYEGISTGTICEHGTGYSLPRQCTIDTTGPVSVGGTQAGSCMLGIYHLEVTVNMNKEDRCGQIQLFIDDAKLLRPSHRHLVVIDHSSKVHTFQGCIYNTWKVQAK